MELEPGQKVSIAPAKSKRYTYAGIIVSVGRTHVVVRYQHGLGYSDKTSRIPKERITKIWNEDGTS